MKKKKKKTEELNTSSGIITNELAYDELLTPLSSFWNFIFQVDFFLFHFPLEVKRILFQSYPRLIAFCHLCAANQVHLRYSNPLLNGLLRSTKPTFSFLFLHFVSAFMSAHFLFGYQFRFNFFVVIICVAFFCCICAHQHPGNKIVNITCSNQV